MSWKKVVLVLVIGTCLLMLSGRAIFCRGVEFVLNHTAPMKGGWHFTFESVEFHPKRIAFIGAKAACATAQCSIEAVYLFWKRYGCTLSLEKPIIHLQQDDQEIDLFGLLHTVPLHIEEATVALIDQDKCNVISFSYSCDNSGESLGTLHVSPLGNDPSCLSLTWYDKYTQEVVAEEVALPWMADVLAFFSPTIRQSVVLSGVLEGRMRMATSRKGVVEKIDGSLVVSGCKARYKGLSIEGEKISAQFTYPKQQSVTLQGVKVGYNDNLAVCDIEGTAHIDQEVKIDLSCMFVYDGKHIPVIVSEKSQPETNAFLALTVTGKVIPQGIDLSFGANTLSFTSPFNVRETMTLRDTTAHLGIAFKEGTVTAEIKGNLTDYVLYGKVRSSYDKGLAFDLRLDNTLMSLVRLTGKTDGTTFLLDREHSNIFGCKPKVCYNNASREFLGKWEIPGDELPRIVQVASLFGIKLPKCPMIEGVLDTTVSYQAGAWSLQVVNEQLQCSVHGDPQLWVVESLRWRNYNATCALVPVGRTVAIEGLVVDSPFGTAHFTTGVIDLETQCLEASLAPTTLTHQMMGECTVEGTIEFACDTMQWQGSLGVAGKKGEVEFVALHPARFTYRVGGELRIEEAEMSLFKKDLFAVDLAIPALTYQAKHLQSGNVKASFTEHTIRYFSHALPWIEALPVNTEGATTLVFDLAWEEDSVRLGGFLEKGSYLWRGNVLALEGLSFQYDPQHLDIYFQMPLVEKNWGVTIKVLPYDTYETTLTAFMMQEEETDEHLTLECCLNGPTGLAVERLEGNLFGVDFHLLPIATVADSQELLFLGSAKVDMTQLAPLLGQELRDFVAKCRLGKGYEAQGELTIVKDDWRQSSFNGFVKGKDFSCFGIELKTLLAQIQLTKNYMKVTDLIISDDAAGIEVPSIVVRGNVLRIPEVRLENVQPSLFKRPLAPSGRMKPFRITTGFFRDIQGSLDDLRSLTGEGHLEFVNTFKDGHILLDVPIEIISRIGLDPVLLVPIQGEIDCFIEGGKIVFAELQNTFSESKRSAFYLWHKHPSYIDFHGNMHIDIRMKQYVLLKITELFILSIRGTIDQPKVSLR